MKKILLMVVGILLVIGLAGAGTWAYFSDTETSGDNVFQAGTIDLTIGGTGAAGVTFTDMKPGDTATATIVVTNAGTLPGSLYATSWYVENDMASPPTPDMTRDDVAKMLVITAFTADTVDILTSIPVGPGTDPTVWSMVTDATAASVSNYADPVPPADSTGGTGWYSYDTDMTVSEVHTYVLTLQFDTAAGNDYQGDGITWTFEFLLTQQ